MFNLCTLALAAGERRAAPCATCTLIQRSLADLWCPIDPRFFLPAESRTAGVSLLLPNTSVPRQPGPATVSLLNKMHA